MSQMSDRSFAYRFSPKLSRFLGITYAPSVSSGYTFAPARGTVSSNTYSPSYSNRSNYSPLSYVSTDDTYSPFYDTSTDYSPSIKSSDDYNPFTFIDKKNLYAPFDYYDYEDKTNYSPTNIYIKKPKVIIDNSLLKYLTAYNKYILGILEVL